MTEALRRIKPETPADEDDSRQQLFTPAWTLVPEDVERHAPSAAAAPAPVPTPVPAPEPRRERLGPLPLPAAPASGTISFSSRWKERLAAGADANPALVEQFRRLAATLHHAHQENNLRSVMVTSAAPADGKTLTAINLALVLAESYRYNVLLIDADLRRPSIPNVMEVGGGSGLSDALIAQTDRKLALVPITPRLALLPAGRAVANSIEALTSPRMRQILEEAGTRFDWVILDAPPVGAAADARLLCQMVGGTLFVIHAGQTQYPAVQRAIESLGRDQILGVVLNAVEETPDTHYYYYGSADDTAKDLR